MCAMVFRLERFIEVGKVVKGKVVGGFCLVRSKVI